MDTIFFGSCLNICAHFQILRKQINKMDLKEFVNYHRSVIDMTKKLNRLLSTAVFLEFLIFSLLLCVTAFEVVMGDNFVRVMIASIHVSAAFVDLLIYSYGGQRVMDCSMEICDDCYKLDRNYFLIMIRAHRELKIEALVFHASLPTFSIVLSRTMSLITLFRSFV